MNLHHYVATFKIKSLGNLQITITAITESFLAIEGYIYEAYIINQGLPNCAIEGSHHEAREAMKKTLQIRDLGEVETLNVYAAMDKSATPVIEFRKGDTMEFIKIPFILTFTSDV